MVMIEDEDLLISIKVLRIEDIPKQTIEKVFEDGSTSIVTRKASRVVVIEEKRKGHPPEEVTLFTGDSIEFFANEIPPGQDKQ